MSIHVKFKSRDLTLRLKPVLQRSTLGGSKILLINPLIFATDSFLPEFNWTWLLVLKYGALSDARNPEEPGQRLGTPWLKLLVFEFQVLHREALFLAFKTPTLVSYTECKAYLCWWTHPVPGQQKQDLLGLALKPELTLTICNTYVKRKYSCKSPI